MNSIKEDKIAALASIRNQLGAKITTGAEWARVQETRSESYGWAQSPGQASPGQPLLAAVPGEREEPEERSVLEGEWLRIGRGIPRGQLTEIVERDDGDLPGDGASPGGAGLAMAALLHRARCDRQYVMLLDVGSGFSVESFPEKDLESLLWVGCASAAEAIEALDIASRDENFALFLLDFRNCEPGEWRSLRPRQWYRVLGQMRQRSAAAVLFAETPVTPVSRQKWKVRTTLSCRDLDRERVLLWEKVAFSRSFKTERQGKRTVDYRRKTG